jgi:hypothetical protein
MSSYGANASPLDTLDELLSALESAASGNEWDTIAILEPRLSEFLAQLPQKNSMGISTANRATLASLLARVEALRSKLEARSQQIAPLLGALVPMDDISQPETP